MFETYMMGEQQLREMALNAMLLAVDAQASAIKSMDREHSFGMENSFSVDRLRGDVKDFVQSTHTLVKAAPDTCVSELREKLTALSANARNIKAYADRFNQEARPRAQGRYERILMQLGVQAPKAEGSESVSPAEAEPGKAPAETEISRDPKVLSSQAHFACLRAEVDEYQAFSMQIHAVVNLAIEYALNAALKCSRCHSNI